VIISRLVIALTSRAICRACLSIGPRLYPARRTSLNAYDPDIFSAYHSAAARGCLRPAENASWLVMHLSRV
jgi:hypothetical protein